MSDNPNLNSPETSTGEALTELTNNELTTYNLSVNDDIKVIVGSFKSSNPKLWYKFNEETEEGEYLIADKPPHGEPWFEVTQFCSLLALYWLQNLDSKSKFGLGDLSDPQKVEMVKTLISMTDGGLDAQVKYVETQMKGKVCHKGSTDFDSVLAKIISNEYKKGTKIWAGSDSHSISIYIRGEDKILFYEPNTGEVVSLTAEEFQENFFNTSRPTVLPWLTTFVVSDPNDLRFSALETKPKLGDGASAVQLSAYIIAFAGAAKVAQKALSDDEDPMTIKEYKFDVNITSDIKDTSATDVSLNVWRMSLTEKLTLEYNEHMGITISCTIVPAATLAQ